MNIDWKDIHAKEILEIALTKLINSNLREINIKNIVSQEFIDLYDVEYPTDFNGWQCDWWSYMKYKGIKINVQGGAFYGTNYLSIDE